MATKTVVKTSRKKDSVNRNIPRISGNSIDSKITKKVVVGFAHKVPRYVVEDMYNVVYK